LLQAAFWVALADFLKTVTADDPPLEICKGIASDLRRRSGPKKGAEGVEAGGSARAAFAERFETVLDFKHASGGLVQVARDNAALEGAVSAAKKVGGAIFFGRLCGSLCERLTPQRCWEG
jgi:hypothetical protein